MTLKRMDNVLIVIDDLEAVLGLAFARFAYASRV